MPGALVASLLAFGQRPPSLSLAQLHPAGLPDCELIAVAHDLRLSLGASVTMGFELDLPTDPQLAGTELTQQFVQLELDTHAEPLSLSSSNVLWLMLGAF